MFVDVEIGRGGLGVVYRVPDARANALDKAHRDKVHRDSKPGSVMLGWREFLPQWGSRGSSR